MINVLTELMEAGQYDQCLKQTEQQLLKGGWTIKQLAHINFIICRCRLGIQDPAGAIPSGTLAVKLAKDLGAWDLLGRALLSVGTAYVGIGQYDQALKHFYGYFEHISKYKESLKLEGAIWRHIGITHQRCLQSGRAIDALNRAREWFTQAGIDRSAFSCTHDLVNTYLQIHETSPSASLDPVLELLRAEKHLVERNPGDRFMSSRHLLDQASAYLHQKRLGRAMVRANQAIEAMKGDHLLSFHAHMVLYRCNMELDRPREALGYALTARIEALQGKAYELEFPAAQAMADVIRKQATETVKELDVHFMAMGIDLGQYLSPSLLRRDN